jgi:hypothetical protein
MRSGSARRSDPRSVELAPQAVARTSGQPPCPYFALVIDSPHEHVSERQVGSMKGAAAPALRTVRNESALAPSDPEDPSDPKKNSEVTPTGALPGGTSPRRKLELGTPKLGIFVFTRSHPQLSDATTYNIAAPPCGTAGANGHHLPDMNGRHCR